MKIELSIVSRGVFTVDVPEAKRKLLEHLYYPIEVEEVLEILGLLKPGMDADSVMECLDSPDVASFRIV